MRKLYVVRLQEEERTELQALVRKGKTAAYTLTHARVLLKADQGASGKRVTDKAVAAAVEVARQRWRGFASGSSKRGWRRPCVASRRRGPRASDDSMGRPRPRSSPPRVVSRPRAASGGRCVC